MSYQDPFRISVSHSRRRKRTVGASLVGDELTVTVPWWMSDEDVEHWVDVMSSRFAKRLDAARIDLPARAAKLAARYGMRTPESITWAGELRSRWGSCTPATGHIRLSSKLVPYPDWVLDYVIVHELAHLHVRGHSKAFWELVGRYPKAERAIGYLIAKSGRDEPDHDASDDAGDDDSNDAAPDFDGGADACAGDEERAVPHL